jgi:putative membrane protein
MLILCINLIAISFLFFAIFLYLFISLNNLFFSVNTKNKFILGGFIMDNNNIDARNYSRSNTFAQVILRFVTSAVILAITAFFTPGFTINNIWALALAAVVLTVIDFLLVKFTGLHASAFGKGFVGFVLAAVVLYATQFFVAGYSISWIAAMIGALIYGVVDYFIPEQH